MPCSYNNQNISLLWCAAKSSYSIFCTANIVYYNIEKGGLKWKEKKRDNYWIDGAGKIFLELEWGDLWETQ